MRFARLCFGLLLLTTAASFRAQTMDRLSGVSLRLTVLHDNVPLANATGAVVQKGSRYYVITNRHVVLQCIQSQDPNNVGAWLCANKVEILHNKLNLPGEWLPVTEDLFDAHNNKRWLEHPPLGTTEHPIPGSSVDLVALPLAQTAGIAFMPLNLQLRNTDMTLFPGDPVSIVGFPNGLAQSGGLAIWKSGTIASDLEVSIDGQQEFLVDTTSRPGMSGSPVYARRSGTFQGSGGMNQYPSTPGTVTKFLGIYSAQNQNNEIGFIWKAEAVQRLYDSLP